MNGAETRVDNTANAGSRREITPGAGARMRPARGFLLLFLLGFANGCYSNVPITSAPSVGQTLNFGLTDEGRVALGKTVGPQVSSIEGVLESASDSAYALRVRSVTYLNGQTNVWNGERIVVPRMQLLSPRERRFSSKRTALAGLIGVAGVALFIASRSLLGSGSPDPDPPGGGGGETQFRLRLH
jgi:hypothetical protein